MTVESFVRIVKMPPETKHLMKLRIQRRLTPRITCKVQNSNDRSSEKNRRKFNSMIFCKEAGD